MPAPIQLLLNGKPVQTTKSTLDQFLIEQGYDPDTVATAVDRQFIARDKRRSTMLDEGCIVDVVAPMQGG